MWAQKRQWIPHKMNYRHPCWTVGAIFTFGRSQIFGPDKLQPSTVGLSQSCKIKKNEKLHHESFDQQSFQLNR